MIKSRHVSRANDMVGSYWSDTKASSMCSFSSDVVEYVWSWFIVGRGSEIRARFGLGLFPVAELVVVIVMLLLLVLADVGSLCSNLGCEADLFLISIDV